MLLQSRAFERAKASRNFDTGGSQKYTMRYFGIDLQWKESKRKKSWGLERVWPCIEETGAGRCGSLAPSVGPPIQCQWVPGHRRGRSYHGPSDASPPPPPTTEGRGGGGRGDGDGVQVADEGDDHQGGFPPHTVLCFVSTLVLLPLAQSCWRQTVCHSRGSGDTSQYSDLFLQTSGVMVWFKQ